MRSEGERVTDWRKEREINGGQREIRVPWRTTTAKSGGFRGGVEWSGLVVGGSQISDVEQEGEQDRCVENELDLGWIGLGWWRSRWRRQWASNGDYMCDLAGVGVRRDRCDLGLGLVLGATRPMLLVRFPYCFSLSFLQSVTLSPSNLTFFFCSMFLFWFLDVLSVYIEIFYNKIGLDAEKMAEKMWKIYRKIAILECY